MPQVERTAVELGIDGLDDAVEVGRGGFGVVFRARQTALRRHVAVKLLLSSPTDDEAMARFAKEGTAMGSLSGHPNVVTLHEHGLTAGGSPYLMLEYLPGGSTADQLQRGSYGADDATELGVHIAGALASAHGAGVLHRDIKPANILIGSFGEPKLGDFGIAVLDGTVTSSKSAINSPAHVPPEIVDGEPASPASDVYSLASTLYELVSGSPAFVRPGDRSIMVVLARLATEAPPPLSTHGVPAPLDEAIRGAMAKSPDERPATSAAFAASLNDAREALGLAPVDLRVLDLGDGIPYGAPDAGRSGAGRRDGAIVATVPLPGVVPTNPRHKLALAAAGRPLPTTGREPPDLRRQPAAAVGGDMVPVDRTVALADPGAVAATPGALREPTGSTRVLRPGSPVHVAGGGRTVVLGSRLAPALPRGHGEDR